MKIAFPKLRSLLPVILLNRIGGVLFVAAIAMGPSLLQIWHERMVGEVSLACVNLSHDCQGESSTNGDAPDPSRHDPLHCPTCVQLFLSQHAVVTLPPITLARFEGVISIVPWHEPEMVESSKWHPSARPRGPPAPA